MSSDKKLRRSLNRIKFRIISILGLLTYLVAPSITYAMCPICTAAVAGGVGLARYLKIDDVITGLWIGAFIVSTIGWTINYLNKKDIKFFGRKILITVLYYLMIVYPLYLYNFIGHPANKIFGLDRLGVGIAIGSIVFFVAAMWYQLIKKANGGHAQFKFQNIVIPIAPLIILSLAFYFLLKSV